MKTSRAFYSNLHILFLILTLLAAVPSALAVTFTNDTLISFNNTSFEGQDIVVTNCTLTVDGSHSFGNVRILNRGTLTHTYATNGLIQTLLHIVAEQQILSDTNPPILNNPNVLADTIRVTDVAASVTYTQGIDYAAVPLGNGYTELTRLTNSAITDGATILICYDALSVPVDTGLNLTVTTNVEIEAGGAINVNSGGYGGGLGQGHGASGSSAPNNYAAGSGGGYGGYGGAASTLVAGGNCYGSILTDGDRGSGGGAGFGGLGGAGGGAIKLTISKLLRVSGQISANGADGLNGRSGGGSGGGISVTAQLLTGTGSISANGGAGEPNDGGGGGGGRIALRCSTNQFAGIVMAHGGAGATAGGAGTIFTSTNNGINGLILADNGGQSGTNTLLSSSGPYDLTISGGAVVHPASQLYSFSRLLIRSNSFLTHIPMSGPLNMTFTGGAVIESGGGINTDSKGSNAGLGAGQVQVYLSTYVGSGAGNGGYGGSAITNAVGGNAMGSMTTPVEVGSGGGDRLPHGLGSHGGGAIHLTITGTLLLNGRISADGAAGIGPGSGGGSGGSIWVVTGTLAGSGAFSANGGAGNLPFGGGGGGGRIAIYYNTNQFTGSTVAQGGVGANSGGAGTIYSKATTNSTAQILVNNGGLRGAYTPLSLANSTSDLVVGGGAVVLPVSLGKLGTLFIGSNSWMAFTNTTQVNPLISADRATIEDSAGIQLDGRGYASGQGPGLGRSLFTSPFGYTGGGGGAGGNGGTSAYGAVGGASYGVVDGNAGTIGFTSGSGGGVGNGNGTNNMGGAGGGAVAISVAGLLTLNGTITANGNVGLGQGSGGGSGGGIYLAVGGISGHGALFANGGSGDMPYGGGGGGGRIAVISSSNLFTGTMSARGGAGANYGGAGTIYIRSSPNATAQVTLDNGGFPATNTLLTLNGVFNLTLSGGAQIFLAGQTSFGNLFIGSNSFLSFSSSYAPRTLSVLTNATILGNGGIVLDGQGFAAGAGPGLGGTYVNVGGGGGYGGYGGRSMTNAFGGNSYGSISSPIDLGSGGGLPGTVAGSGSGGGALHLTVRGTLQLDGSISANGIPGLQTGSGGGSGGSLWLSAGRLVGAGQLSANGGAGDFPNGGGGGGGRIAVYANTNEFTGKVIAYGGASLNAGGAGTVYLSNSNAVIQVTADNGGLIGTNTPITITQSGVFDLTVSGGAQIFLAGVLQLRNLLVATNSVLTFSQSYAPRTITVSNNATIQSGGVIQLTGQGFQANLGTGFGGTLGLTYGGAGYGGYGGSSISNAAGGNYYGSILSPLDMGSGGGGPSQGVSSGAGGGALKLSVTGALLLDGLISADGSPAITQNGGGGSGGSIWLTVGSLAGKGAVSANGGSGDLPNGGGGGGGRIAVYYNSNSNTFAGSFSAHGGPGANYGGAGTIYLRSSTNAIAQVIADNAGGRGTNTLLSLSGVYDLTINSGAQVMLQTAEEGRIRNLLIASNAWLSAPASPQARSLIATNVTIQRGGAIVLDGQGNIGGLGTGRGATLAVAPFGATGGGAGNAGYGGSSAFGAAGGTAFGSTSALPTEAGSGGGAGIGNTTNNLGGAGGGALIFTVSGLFVLDGNFTLDGKPGVGLGSGGGSGGNLYLKVGKLTGAGLISANGGPGDAPYGGGGGGGHIVIVFGTNQFTGVLAARGGSGSTYGGAGTICTLDPNDLPFGILTTVIADNGGARGTNTLLSLLNNYDLTIRGAASVVPASGTIRNLVINSNSWLTMPLKGTFPLTVLNDATVQATGGVSGDGGGNSGGQGIGTGGTTNNIDLGYTGGGGGYGGYGGVSVFGASGGNSYGSIVEPFDLGSGGGGYSPTIFGAAGGGAIHLTVRGNLSLNGVITSNGRDAFYDSSGGGSGGSIWLNIGLLSGSGRISANGGAGDYPQGGGGGGGRIAVYSSSNQFSGAISALGGPGFVFGGAGTIYSHQGNAASKLIVDNGGWVGTNTPISSPQAFDVTISGGATANPSGPALTFNNLSVDSGATFTHLNTQTNMDITVISNATIGANGTVSVNGDGYHGANGGPGAGQMPPGSSGSGAGYGGAGGASASGTPGGLSYGSAFHPIDRGSRGGISFAETNSNFSEGAGAVRLKVGGLMTLNGRMTANGNDGIYDRSGGGAGGSIWVSARQFAGTGFITANGGAGEPVQGGGGGGGRVAVYSRVNNFHGPVVAYGAEGAAYGANGSVVLSDLPAPQVIAQAPVGSVVSAVGSVILYFDALLNFQTVTTADIVVTTPSGVLPQNSLVVSASGADALLISFPSQTNLGTYSIQAGPAIEDIYGLPMAGAYLGSFVISPPIISGRVVDTNGLGISSVTLTISGNPTPVMTDANGSYSIPLFPGWTGTITPTKVGSVFIPGTRSYANLGSNATGQNFVIVAPSALAISVGQQGGNLNLQWFGINGVTYQPLCSTDLLNWQTCIGPILGTNGPIMVAVPIGAPAQFFRFNASYGQSLISPIGAQSGLRD
jgi:hypothetical protein